MVYCIQSEKRADKSPNKSMKQSKINATFRKKTVLQRITTNTNDYSRKEERDTLTVMSAQAGKETISLINFLSKTTCLNEFSKSEYNL